MCVSFVCRLRFPQFFYGMAASSVWGESNGRGGTDGGDVERGGGVLFYFK